MLRPDLAIIANWIKPGSRVLDLGCGDGTLMHHLTTTRQVTGYGIEIDEDGVAASVRAGINVIQSDLDAGLSDFDRDVFDYVVMTQTLQAVNNPSQVIDEMLRVGREGIVTFPNFGHWRTRLGLMLGGRMPLTRSLPNHWYDTPNIHLCTIKDFDDLCRDSGISVLERELVDISHKGGHRISMFPNMMAEIALYRIQRL